MAQFYAEDVCAFESDPFIVATVEHTWRDLGCPALPQALDTTLFDSHSMKRIMNIPSSVAPRGVYWHRDTPKKVRKELMLRKRPAPGYIVVSFAQPHDFLCLIAEKSLILVDRALAAGDIVKRQLSDAQSGTIISTSLKCGLRPSCSALTFAEKEPRKAHGLCPAYYEHRNGHSPCSSQCVLLEIPDQHRTSIEELYGVPASELEHWNKYRENDYIIYRDWIGCIRYITDEVTIRLNNGSVVVVEDPEELEQSWWVDGSLSSELHKRLFQADYLLNWSKKNLPGDMEAKTVDAMPCYPGQIVKTKKGNLRRGRWKFGAYDPNVIPQGIVVEVRHVQLEVAWRLPNIFMPYRAHTDPPSSILDLDVLESGKITVYDLSKQPPESSGHDLSGASYSPDIAFGGFVRFKDVAGAAVKYDGTQVNRTSQDTINHFRRTPRTATQGFDMNVLEVTRTQTIVVVQWQDSTITKEDSVFLVPYINVDDQDVWPGDYVSLQAEEEVNEDYNTIRCGKIGVVQSVDASERIARVRWFTATVATVCIDDRSTQVSPTSFGPIGDEYSIVSLFDITVYSAYGRSRGDLMIAVPSPLPPASSLYAEEQSEDVKQVLDHVYHGLNRHNGDDSPLHSDDGSSVDTHITDTPNDIDWLGDVVDMHLDGDVTLRLRAASEVHDIKLPFERCVVAVSDQDYYDSSESSEEEDPDVDDKSIELWSDYSADSEVGTVNSGKTIEMEIEYEGGDRLDNESDDEMWSTEDDEQIPQSISTSSKSRNDQINLANLRSDNVSTAQNEMADSQYPQNTQSGQESNTASTTVANTETLASELQLSTYSSMPAQFALLEESPPADHHFLNHPSHLTALTMRRIAKEHGIMRSSLPSGIFVRAWESRLDLLRVLIIGPRDTPYELAPFVIDFHFADDFPENPPKAHFHSWTDGRGRINPNLYEDGTICISLLGTWPGDEKDTWSAKGSTMLQIIVSLLGLVLVQEPYFNEAGFDILANTDEACTTSALYTERAFVLARGFVQRALSSKPGGVADIIEWLYDKPSTEGAGPWLLRTVIEEARARIADRGEEAVGKKLSRGAAIMLERTVAALEEHMKRGAEGDGGA